MSSTLRPRHDHIVSRLVDAFELSAEECRAAVRKALPLLLAVFNGDPTAPAHVLAFYQPRDVKAEVRSGGVRGCACGRSRSSGWLHPQRAAQARCHQCVVSGRVDGGGGGGN